MTFQTVSRMESKLRRPDMLPVKIIWSRPFSAWIGSHILFLSSLLSFDIHISLIDKARGFGYGELPSVLSLFAFSA